MPEFKTILTKISEQFNNKLPFVIYSIPRSKDVSVILQKDDKLYITNSFTKECFVFAPFNYQNESYCIPSEKSNTLITKFNTIHFDYSEISTGDDLQKREEYCDDVKKIVRTIKYRNASKIVFSRKKEVSLRNFDLETLIIRILNLYPTAFRYVWYHPKTGLWCGASPETLLQTEGISFKTMALAGTQKTNGNEKIHWNNKELSEQKIVVDEITTSLQKVTSVVRISKTYNHQAASLVHLRTDITGILKKGKTTISSITSVLHPTPAVCGAPQEYANKYILENENYNREFYTGFLGPVCSKNSCSSLFVNLRCMKIENTIANLFVGGGITIDSEPESEWEETQHKLQTMLQVLQPML